MSDCICVCGDDDDLGPFEISGMQLLWSRFDMLVPPWGPKYNKQIDRKIKKSTFQAVGELSKHKL